MFRVVWTEEKWTEMVIKEAQSTRCFINGIRKRLAILFGYVMREEKMEHLVTIEIIVEKHSRGSRRDMMT